MNPLTLSSTLAQLWIDSSVQTVRTAAELWNGVLSAGVVKGGGHTAQRTSTASPWWKTPEATQAAAQAFQPFAWPPMWPLAAAPKSTTPDLTQFWASAWAPWLQHTAAPTPSTLNAMEFWQQAWLRSMPQLTALTASLASPPGLGSTWPAMTPLAAATPPIPAAWQPMMAAYRTANGHAMAAVLRTFADVVEPKPRQPNFMDFWPNPLGTRH